MCVSNVLMYSCLRWCKRWYHKLGLNHVLLFIFYLAYLGLGASMFYILEHDSADHFRDQWRQKVKGQRDGFIMTQLMPDIFNNSRFLVYIHEEKTQDVINILQDKLSKYERRLEIRPPMPYLQWTFGNSFLYCWSTITTIGHGYIYPVTNRGRVASVIYSIFGIPFTIVVIKDLAYLLAKLLNYPGVLLGYCWHVFRYCTLRPINEQYLRRKCDVERRNNNPNNPDYRIQSVRRLLNIPAMVAIFALIGWLSMGSFLMVAYEEHMSASVAFYFLFNTLATTGVGDIEPRHPVVLLVMFGYVLVGLAVVSMFINLLHAKFSRAYWLPDPIILGAVDKGGKVRSPQSNVASFDSDLSISDTDLNHYVTLGVLQAEDRRPLLAALLKERGYRHAEVQTTVSLPTQRSLRVLQKDGGFDTSAVYLPQPTASTSHDDVHKLMTETYTGRPPRLIM